MHTPVGPLSVLLIFASLALTALMMAPSFTSFLIFMVNGFLLFALRAVARIEARRDLRRKLAINKP
jgi:hypothetical protein